MSNQVQIVLLSLSGVGKSTVQRLLAASGECEAGITCTTRKRRPGEPIDAYDYISPFLYWLMAMTGQMCERSANYGTKYGILRSRIDRAHQADKPTVWVLNAPGLEWMRREFGPENVLPILLYAPIHVLRERMEKRGDAPEDIERRLKAVPQEVAAAMSAGAIQIDTEHLSPQYVAAEVRSLIHAWQSGRR